jgi:Flp pilus assembly pilin Flp
MKTLNKLRSFAKSEEGAVYIEYALLAALIAVVSITALTDLGSTISSFWGYIEGELNSASTT